MSKALEALKRMVSDNGYDYSIDNFWEDYKVVETALKRLEEIDKVMFLNNQKTEKQTKILQIIKKNIKHFIDFEDNTNRVYIDCAIDCETQEEYDLLKEWLK